MAEEGEDARTEVSEAPVRSLDPAEVESIARVIASTPSATTSSADGAFGPDTYVKDTVHTERPDGIIGQMIHGYRVEARLGGGSFSGVFRARHQVLDKECAVKILLDEFAGEDAAQRRLRREAQMMSRVVHENIAAVLDFGSTSDGKPFLMTELLRGPTLDAVLEREGQLSPGRSISIARQIASGLDAAHRLGLIHRDLKPANMILVDTPRGQVIKILDFGLVRVIRASGALTKLTTTGFMLGTPAYAAPEQIRNPSACGVEADVYSLGIILYEMLSGKRPFQGQVYEVLIGHLESPPPPLGDFGGLEALVAAMLDKEAARRPTAREVMERLEKFAAARIPSLPTPPARPRTSERTTRILLVTAALAVGAAGASLVAYSTRPPAAQAVLESPPVPPEVEAVVPRARPLEGPAPGDGAEPEEAEAKSSARKHPTKSGKTVRSSEPAAKAETPMPPNLDAIVARLRHVSALLANAGERLTPQDLERYENRYFKLRTEARPPLSGDKLGDLAARAAALEDEVAGRLGQR